MSPKTLTHPTCKDFVHIVTFLFKKVDSSLKIVGKMEEEVPQIFKKLAQVPLSHLQSSRGPT